MTGAKNHPANNKQCWQAVHLKELHPELSYRQIGSKIGRSQTFASKWIRLASLHNSVADQLRPGRPHKLNAEASQHILTPAQQKQCKAAAAHTRYLGIASEFILKLLLLLQPRTALLAVLMFKENQFTCSPHERNGKTYISNRYFVDEVQFRHAKSGVGRRLSGDGDSICFDWVLELSGLPDKSDRKACLTTGAGAQTTYSST